MRYSDKVEVIRFETEPHRKLHLEPQNGIIEMNGSAKMNGTAQYHIDYYDQLNNNHIIANLNQQLKRDTMIHRNGYHNSLIETEQKKPSSTAVTAMTAAAVNDPTNSDLFRHANIGVTNQKLVADGGDDSSVDSMDSDDSAKRDSEESVIELAVFHQPMIAKDNADGHSNMSNGDGEYPGAGGEPNGAGGEPNGTVNEQRSAVEDIDRCGMECCLYFTLECCSDCSIM